MASISDVVADVEERVELGMAALAERIEHLEVFIEMVRLNAKLHADERLNQDPATNPWKALELECEERLAKGVKW
jgi:hypothetical protein